MSIPSEPIAPERATRRSAPDSLLHMAWRRKWIVALGLVAGVFASYAIGKQLPRVYQSTAQISIVKKRPDAVTGIDTRPLAAEESISPAHEILRSNVVIESAIKQQSLADRNLSPSEDVDLADAIKQNLVVTPTRTLQGPTPVYKLSFRAHDSDDSRVVLSAVIDSFREFMDKKHQTVSEDTFELILREKKSLERDISEKEAAYRAFREKSPIVGKARDGLDLRQERLNSIQSRRSALLLARIDLEGQLSAVERAQKDGRSEAAILSMLIEFNRKNEPNEAVREKQMSAQEQLFPLLMEERKLLAQYPAKHPEVVQIRERIEIAQKLLFLPPTAWRQELDGPAKSTPAQDPITLHLQLLKQKLDHLRIAESLLASTFQTEQDEARRLASYEIESAALETSIALNQRLYEALTKRLNEISLIRNVGGYQIEVLEPPAIGKRVAPSMILVLVIGAFLGLAVGIGLAGWVDYRDLRYRSTQDAAQSLALPVFPMPARHDAETIWTLRNLLTQAAENAGAKVTLVTDPAGTEGAAMVAEKLAAALAVAGKKVLAINMGAATSNIEALSAAEIAPGVTPIGVNLTAPTALAQFHDLVAKAREQFDYVILSAPSVLTSPIASTTAASADAALLTIALGKTTQPQAERAAHLLASTGAKMLGVVIQGANA